jgi:hypothetical protein
MTPELIDALARIREGMRAGDYERVPEISLLVGGLTPRVDKRERAASGKRLFNMGLWAGRAECGTVCCIGGWLETEMGRRLTESEERTCDALFYPGWGMNHISPEQAADAIQRFLNGGRTREEVWT